jgi:hypothetical protein
LIASIGTGLKNDKGNYPYKDAIYYPAENPGSDVCNTPLVAAALMKLYAIDEVVNGCNRERVLDLLGKNIHSEREHEMIHERLKRKSISKENEYAIEFYNYYYANIKPSARSLIYSERSVLNSYIIFTSTPKTQ